MALSVKQLREQLAALPEQADEWVVVLSEDAEGNGFSPCAELVEGAYVAESTWSGQFKATVDADGFEHVPNAVCLWPVN